MTKLIQSNHFSVFGIDVSPDEVQYGGLFLRKFLPVHRRQLAHELHTTLAGVLPAHHLRGGRYGG